MKINIKIYMQHKGHKETKQSDCTGFKFIVEVVTKPAAQET